MTKLFRLTPILLLALALFGAGAAEAGKQAICHFPPGNPANFHTITISDNAVDKHVAKHGDLIGSCLANCETICDDGDFCTQDVVSDPDQCVCLAEPRPPVDCNDSNDCTADSCNSDIGACLNNAEILDGEACDDGDPGTTDEICAAGECVVPVSLACPCWTQEELDGLRFPDPNNSTEVLNCTNRDDFITAVGWQIFDATIPGGSGVDDYITDVDVSSDPFIGGAGCFVREVICPTGNGTNCVGLSRFTPIPSSGEVWDGCVASVEASGRDRGFDCYD